MILIPLDHIISLDDLNLNGGAGDRRLRAMSLREYFADLNEDDGTTIFCSSEAMQLLMKDTSLLGMLHPSSAEASSQGLLGTLNCHSILVDIHNSIDQQVSGCLLVKLKNPDWISYVT